MASSVILAPGSSSIRDTFQGLEDMVREARECRRVPGLALGVL